MNAQVEEEQGAEVDAVNETETPQEATPREESRAKAIAITNLRAGNGAMSVFSDSGAFGLAQRMAALLSSSTLVPEPYQRYTFDKSTNNWMTNPNAVGNCVIALEIATRLRLSPLMVMQNVDMVKGRPGFRGAFVTALVNGSAAFSRLDYEWKGEPGTKEGRACRAFATEVETGKVLHGTWITWAMVKGEGWSAKKGSKWMTMPDQMFMYRAASFWVRTYAPELLLGMQTSEELEDVHAHDRGSSIDELNARLDRQIVDVTESVPPSAPPANDDDAPEEAANEEPSEPEDRPGHRAPLPQTVTEAEPAKTPEPAKPAAPKKQAPAPAPVADDMFNVE